MAGGMSRRSGWGSMAQRVGRADPAGESAGQSRTPKPRPEDEPAPPVSLKHCWVVDDHGRMPALLLEWRRVESDFQGRVVRPVEEPGIGWIVVEEWLPAALLEPLGPA